jgi:hypothetical protein
MFSKASGQVLRLYHYVGPPEILARVRGSASGLTIQSSEDILTWMGFTRLDSRPGHQVVATFVVDELGRLRLADRRSEHVVCAGGRPVRTAGEICFSLSSDPGLKVEWMTNQSTGYCPEPESSIAVRTALSCLGIEAPERYDPEFQFRGCPSCGSITLIKDDLYECGICLAVLPLEWNLTAGVA